MRGKWLFLGMILVSICGSLVFLGLKVSSKKDAIQKSDKILATLSSVASEVPFTLNEYLKPTILIYMNSECGHCQWQVEELAKKQKELANTQLVLVSYESVDSLASFLKSIGVVESYIKTANIEPEKVPEVFGRILTPQIFIYRDNQLVKSFKGETKVQLITDLL